MILNKKFTIKVYQSNGSTFIKTLNPAIVKTVPTFSSEINGGLGQCVLDLALDFDDFEEGTTIDFMNVVKIYVSDKNNTLGRLIYTGFISAYSPYVDGSQQGVKVTLLGLISLLSLAYYKSGASFTVAHSGVDPSAVMKAIIDHFNTIYSGSLLGYNSGGTTVDSVGTSVAYTFTEKKWIDALNDVFGTVGAGWWWAVDKTGQLYLKQKPAAATHTFTIGSDIESMQIEKTSEKVVNKVHVEYAAGGTNDYSDAGSITNFGTRESIVNDQQIQDATTATQRAHQEVTDNNSEKIKAQLVINTNFDLESILVGDTCKIRNLKKGSTVFNDNMMIVGVDYSFDKVTLQLEDLTKFSTELQNFIS